MTDPMFDHKAELPYGGKSRRESEQQEREDESSTTTARQAATIAFIRDKGTVGATSKELQRPFAWGHGQTSGACSVLHKTGHLARLTEKRDGYYVYVAPEFVGGREMGDYQPAAGPSDPVEVIRHVSTVEIREVPRVLSPDDVEFVSKVFGAFALAESSGTDVLKMKTKTVRRLLTIVSELQEVKG
jgi:hypothetical protein